MCSASFGLDRAGVLRTIDGAPIEQGLRTGAFAEQVVVHASQLSPVPDCDDRVLPRRDVKEVQRMLGHAKASITLDRYTGVLESMQARTDERLDAALRGLISATA